MSFYWKVLFGSLTHKALRLLVGWFKCSFFFLGYWQCQSEYGSWIHHDEQCIWINHPGYFAMYLLFNLIESNDEYFLVKCFRCIWLFIAIILFLFLILLREMFWYISVFVCIHWCFQVITRICINVYGIIFFKVSCIVIVYLILDSWQCDSETDVRPWCNTSIDVTCSVSQIRGYWTSVY